MNRVFKRSAALLLVLALLVGTLPALAVDTTVQQPALMQATAAISIYKDASAKSSKLFTLQKNDAVYAQSAQDGFTQVQAGDVSGYVQTNKLAKLSSSANLIGLYAANAKTNMLVSPDSKAKASAALSAGTQVALLARMGDWLAVLYNGNAGFVNASACKSLDASSPVQSYALAKAKTVVYAGPEANAKKLATLSTAGILPKLGVLGAKTAVSYNGKLGFVATTALTDVTDATLPTGYVQAAGKATVMEATGAKPKTLGTLAAGEIHGALGTAGTKTLIRYGKALGLIDTSLVKATKLESLSATSMAALSAAPIYNGPNAKFVKLGQFAKGDAVQKIGEVGTFTIVLYNKQPGYVATKSLGTAAQNTPATSSGGYPAITTEYVECNGRASVYRTASGSSTVIGPVYDGTLLRFLGMEGENWVRVYYGGVTAYIERKYVDPNNYNPKTDDIVALGEDVAVAQFISLTNGYRKAAGLRALVTDDTLMRAALVRVQELTVLFEHKRPDGTAPNTLHSSILGENIAKGKELPTPLSAAKGFMSSPGHKENVLRSIFTKTGAACLKWNGAYYWVQLFG